MKISAVMIVRNEEALIGRCLESLKDFDEVVVLDTGSTDDTEQVAKLYKNVKFIGGVYTWNDDFAEARNKAIEYSTGDWNFTIDADEYLDPGAYDRLKECAEGTTQDAIDIPNEAESDGSIHYLPRLFRNKKDIKYHGAVHNYLSAVPGARLDTVILHYGYSPAHKKDPDRALRILKKEVDKNRACTREKFYLAREYWYRHDWVTALYWYDEYLKVGRFWPEVAEAHLVKARCLFYLFRGDEARDACLQAIKLNSNFQEAIEFMALMSGPGNKKRWLQFAATATNESVLFIRTTNKKRVYYCEGMKTFGEAMIKYHGYERYNPDLDIWRDTFFEGLYFNEDFDVLKKHCGRAIVFWNGTDITRLSSSPHRRTTDWYKYRHFCHNIEDCNRLREKFGIIADVRPIFFGDVLKYKVSYRQSNSPTFFTNAHPGREYEYGIPTVLAVAAQMPDVTFVIYGIDGANITPPIPPNVIFRGIVPEETMDEEIKSCQGCLKLNPSGISQIVVKAGLMGLYPITMNKVDHAKQAENVTEIILAIDEIKSTEAPNLDARKFFFSTYENSLSKIWDYYHSPLEPTNA